jgi:hypothetical protein
MSQQRENPVTFAAGEDLVAFRRVKISGSTVIYADAADKGLGVVQAAVDISEDTRATIRLDNYGGTSKMVASGAISAGVATYAATDGKVASSGSVVVGVSVEASTANNDVIEVMPVDLAVLASDLEVTLSDTLAAASDAQVNASDITTNASDIVIIKSDVTVGGSNTTVHISDMRVAISDAIFVNDAGDTANVSDLVVTIGEFLAAFSDALG